MPSARKRPPIVRREDFSGYPIKASHLLDGAIHGYWFDEQPVQQAAGDGYVAPTEYPFSGAVFMTPQATRLSGVGLADDEPGEKYTIRRFTLTYTVSSEAFTYNGSITGASIDGLAITEANYNGVQFNPTLLVTVNRPDDFDPPLIDAGNISDFVSDGYFIGSTLSPSFDWYEYLNDRHIDGALSEASYMQTVTQDETEIDPSYSKSVTGKAIFDAIIGALTP